MSRLLAVRPEQRLTAPQALAHAWFTPGRGAAAVALDATLGNLRMLDLRFRVAVRGVVAARRISSTLSRISEGFRTTRSTDSMRLRSTVSVVPESVVNDAAAAAEAGGAGKQAWGKQIMAEGVWGRADGGLETVSEGGSRGASCAGGMHAVTVDVEGSG